MRRIGLFFANWFIYFTAPIWIIPYVWYQAILNEEAPDWKTGKEFIFGK